MFHAEGTLFRCICIAQEQQVETRLNVYYDYLTHLETQTKSSHI